MQPFSWTSRKNITLFTREQASESWTWIRTRKMYLPTDDNKRKEKKQPTVLTIECLLQVNKNKLTQKTPSRSVFCVSLFLFTRRRDSIVCFLFFHSSSVGEYVFLVLILYLQLSSLKYMQHWQIASILQWHNIIPFKHTSHSNTHIKFPCLYSTISPEIIVMVSWT